MDHQSEFKKKREQFSINIRKQRRQNKIREHRNQGLIANSNNSDQIEEQNQVPQFEIIDQQRYSQIKQILQTPVDEEQLPTLLNHLNSQNILEKHQGIISIRKLLGKCNQDFIQMIVESTNFVKICIQFYKQKQYPQLRLEAIWSLSNIAAGSKQQCKFLSEHGVIVVFLECLKAKEKGITEQVLSGIGNLAADHPSYRNQFINGGALTPLLRIIDNNQDNMPFFRSAVWAITNLCRGHNLPQNNNFRFCLQTLCYIIRHGLITDKDQSADICWAISNLIEDKTDIRKVHMHKIFFRLREYALSDYYVLSMGALKLIGTLSLGSIDETYEMIEGGIYEMIQKIFASTHRINVKRQVCWFLSNVIIGPAKHTDKFFQHPKLVEKVVSMFDHDEPEIKREICWVLSNIGHCGNLERLITFFQQYQIMRMYSQALNFDQCQDLLENALESLGKILNYGQRCKIHQVNVMLKAFENYNGHQKLEALQQHESRIVYARSADLIKRYWQIQEQNDLF